MNDFITNILGNLEWYDNSGLETIDRCVRKRFWRDVFTLTTEEATQLAAEGKKHSGIEERMGHAAYFGTAIHRAFDVFYSPQLYETKTYQQRRLLSLRSFDRKHRELFPPDTEVDNKYSLLRGIDLLDLYFDFYENEDQLFEPVETEIACIVRVEYRPTDPYHFLPFLYVARMDGILRRKSYDDYWIIEHKTAGSPDQKLNELRIGHQPRRYFFALKHFPSDRPIEGVIPNVIATRASETNSDKLFFRDYVHLSDIDADVTRLQLIHKVTRWRNIRQIAATIPPGPAQIAAFDQSTAECTRYGLCSYYDLCLYGPEAVDLTRFHPNTWNPLNAEKLED